MCRNLVLTIALLLSVSLPLAADWERVEPGIHYRKFTTESRVIHVTRIDLRSANIRVIGTREADRGTTVSQYARRNNTVIAINGDYFDEKRNPIGLSVGPCGTWDGTSDTAREGVVAVDDGKVRIETPADVLEETEDLDAAVSGWPMLVKSCKPIPSTKLPGSDKFTRSPHPRTAVGLSKDGKRLFLVVSEGRQTKVPGLTLGQLAYFMANTLKVCTAINLDGGGSSAMWVAGCVVNEVSDGRERSVANHIGIVLDEDYVACETDDVPEPSYTASCPRDHSTAGAALDHTSPVAPVTNVEFPLH